MDIFCYFAFTSNIKMKMIRKNIADAQAERVSGRLISTQTLAAVSLALVILLSELKDDAGAIAQSVYWNTLTIAPWLQHLKGNPQELIVPLLAAAFLSILVTKKIGVSFVLVPLMVVYLFAFAAFRAFAYDSSQAIRPFFGFIVLISLYGYLAIILSNGGINSFRATIRNALVLSSVALVVCNAINYWQGYGFVLNDLRLFGTTIQPNFLGVQTAIAGIVLFSAIPNGWTYRKIGAVLLLGIDCFLLIATGSRTGLIILVSGLFLVLWARTRLALRVPVYLLMLCFFAAAILSQSISVGIFRDTSFYRGEAGIDTRSAAWLEMINSVTENPIWGRGYFSGASENSYMRGWLAYGLVYEMLFLAVVLVLLRSAVRSVRHYGGYCHNDLFFGLVGGLIIGGIFEGYLVDNFSGPLIIWFLLSWIFGSKDPLLALPVRKNRNTTIAVSVI